MEPQRPGATGYMRTDILGYEDLHPTEGYQFIPRDAIRQTPNSQISSQFPMNKKVNDSVQPVALTETAPATVPDTPTPSTKKHRAKLIFDTMVSTRAKQIDYGQQKRVYDQTVKIAEDEVERQQMEIAKELALRDRDALQRGKVELRETYRTQFEERAAGIRREQAADEATERSLRQYEYDQDRIEAEKQARRKKIIAEQNEEFRRLNADVVARKAARADSDIEEERCLEQKSAEYQALRDARNVEDQRRRLEKTQWRARVANARAKALATSASQSQAAEEQAESDAAQASFDRVNSLKAKYKQLEEERRQEWISAQRDKEARKKAGKSKPFPNKREGVDVEAFDRRQRKIENNRLQDYLRLQIEERKSREKQEIEDDRAADNEMLATRQREFQESLKRLSNLVPESSGIEVPVYTASRSITKFY
jgi:hypothetical protein